MIPPSKQYTPKILSYKETKADDIQYAVSRSLYSCSHAPNKDDDKLYVLENAKDTCLMFVLMLV